MFFPIRTDSPLRFTPWVNWVLLAVNIAVFLIQQAMGRGFTGTWELDPLAPRLITFFTYAFLHADAMHLLGNMIFLYIFGNNLNDKLGNAGYLALYLAGAVFAGIGYVLGNYQPHALPVIGASGAVSAVTGAYLVLFPKALVTVFYFWFFIGTFEVPSLYLILFFFVQDIFFNFTGGGQVAHIAHICGYLLGFFTCLMLLALKLLPRDHFDVLALIQRWNRRREYQSLVRGGFDPFAPAAVLAGKPARVGPIELKIQELRGQIAQAFSDNQLPRAAELYQQLHGIDPNQVLSRTQQLDVANQLAHQQRYLPAADAYELLLKIYPNSPQIEQVQLMLALIHIRYLQQPGKAKLLLQQAITRLPAGKGLDLAKAELQRITGA